MACGTKDGQPERTECKIINKLGASSQVSGAPRGIRTSNLLIRREQDRVSHGLYQHLYHTIVPGGHAMPQGSTPFRATNHARPTSPRGADRARHAIRLRHQPVVPVPAAAGLHVTTDTVSQLTRLPGAQPRTLSGCTASACSGGWAYRWPRSATECRRMPRDAAEYPFVQVHAHIASSSCRTTVPPRTGQQRSCRAPHELGATVRQRRQLRMFAPRVAPA
jgi:hypothetical protein